MFHLSAFYPKSVAVKDTFGIGRSVFILSDQYLIRTIDPSLSRELKLYSTRISVI